MTSQTKQKQETEAEEQQAQTRRILPIALIAIATSTLTSCWPEWAKLFDPTLSTEHRVEDLRVLAIAASPATLLVGADGDAGAIDIAPLVVDPRGGSVLVEISLCARTDGIVPCASGGRLVLLSKTLTVDTDQGLGVVEGAELDDVVITQQQQQELGLPAPTSVPQLVDIVVDVRTIDGRERETATLGLPLVLDPAVGLVVDDGAHAKVCAPDEQDSCVATIEPTCGNGVIEDFETCDPPNGGDCDDFCFSSDFCAPEGPPKCVVPATLNPPPVIVGFLRDDGIFPGGGGAPILLADVVTPDLAPGATLEVQAGETFGILPVIDVVGGNDLGQDFFVAGFDPTCDVISAQCASTEFAFARFYVSDGGVDVVREDASLPANESFSAGALLRAADGAAGDEDVVVVVGDGRGGFAFAPLTIRVR